MRLIVRAKAADDIAAIFAWIAKDNVSAARRVIDRIRERIGKLIVPGLANIGRHGRDLGTRELIESPYIVVYEVKERRKEVVVLAVFHGAQDR